MIDKDLLDILVCPVSKDSLKYDAEEDVLICEKCKLKFPIEDGIPVMLPEKAEKY